MCLLVPLDGILRQINKKTKGEQMSKLLSPLRYPGGKSRAVDILRKYIPQGTKEICSPFFGGGSFELSCANSGIKIYGYDLFLPIVEFWQCLIEDPKRLVSHVQKFYPLSKEKFYELQKRQGVYKNKYRRAAAFFVLNRSSFSGSTLSGGMSPNHPRFTPSAIQRLRDFNTGNFSVEHLDFKKSIKLHKNILLYLDPPYMIEGCLYGKKGNTHKNFDHDGLVRSLKNRNNWILSYNDCEDIRKMYKEFTILTPEWTYGMSLDKKSREVLILSKDLG